MIMNFWLLFFVSWLQQKFSFKCFVKISELISSHLLYHLWVSCLSVMHYLKVVCLDKIRWELKMDEVFYQQNKVCTHQWLCFMWGSNQTDSGSSDILAINKLEHMQEYVHAWDVFIGSTCKFQIFYIKPRRRMLQSHSKHQLFSLEIQEFSDNCRWFAQ